MIPIYVVAAVAAFFAAQIPEYLQQYGQRLGGAIDELSRVVAYFDEDATRSNLDRGSALKLMARNSERLVRDQGAHMQDNVERLGRLQAQRQAFASGGAISRLSAYLADYDSEMAGRVWRDYSYGFPLTADGFLFAAFGFLLACIPLAGLTGPLRRRIA